MWYLFAGLVGILFGYALAAIMTVAKFEDMQSEYQHLQDRYYKLAKSKTGGLIDREV